MVQHGRNDRLVDDHPLIPLLGNEIGAAGQFALRPRKKAAPCRNGVDPALTPLVYQAADKAGQFIDLCLSPCRRTAEGDVAGDFRFLQAAVVFIKGDSSSTSSPD
ncbi:MAG: hypothetical protein MZV70_00610 [Desulfobacterales bacterium]|nr:hypothetical protein [Desulfobacterales bacterium]